MAAVNILYVHRTQGKGVEGVHIRSMVEAFRRVGHSVTILSPSGVVGGDGGDTHQVNGETGRSRTWVHKLYALISRNMPELVFELAEIAYNLSLGARLRRYMATNDIDCIYERYAIFSVAAARAAHRLSIPLILELNYHSGSALVRRRSKLLAPLARRFDDWMFSRASTIAVVSNQLAKELKMDFGVPDHKIVLTPNAADPERIKPVGSCPGHPPGLDMEGRKVIGFVGGFYPWHGLPLLIEAYSQVSKRIPDSVLFLIGEGPEKEKIQKMVNRLGLRERVIFTGSVEHGELPAYISQFTVGVMPDSNDYGSPMKIFEYMAAGKPVVVPDYAPLLDVIEDGRQGYVFKKNSVDSLCDALIRVLDGDEVAKKMGAHARRLIEEERNWERNASLVLANLEKAE